MVASSAMPNLVVEIAFNAGFSTPAASRTWADVSDYVLLNRGINITFGRQDERNSAGANKLSLTLDNSDGRFTPQRAASPYYPNVKLDRPIRITSTPIGGTPSVRFVGFINEWPVAWDQGTSGSASVTITATSRLARLGLNAAFRSIIEETILSDGPAGYYPLGEPKDSTRAADISGNGAIPLSAVDIGPALIFGSAIGPGTDALTALQVYGGQYLTGPPVVAGGTVEFFASWPAATQAAPLAVESSYGEQVFKVSLGVNVSASVAGTVVVQTSGASYADGLTHHVAVTSDGSTMRLYVDGSLAASAASTYVPSGQTLTVGRNAGLVNVGLQCVVAHVAVFSGALTAARVLAHATAGLTGFAGERTDVRFSRYANLAGIPSVDILAESGTTLIDHVDITGKRVTELLGLVEDTEGGVVFDERDGTLRFLNRANRYIASPLFALNMAAQQVEADFAPKLDRSTLLTDATVQNQDASVVARYAAQTDYGPSIASLTTASTDGDEPLHIAEWLVNAYKEPRLRIPSVSIDGLAQVGKTPDVQTLYAASIGTGVRITNQPTQADQTTSDFFVEGYTETYGPESMRLSFNVSPGAPYNQVLIWNDATRGVWDSFNWAY